MKRLARTLIALALAAGATQASAACRPLGSQLECNVGQMELSIGTQVSEPTEVRTVRPLGYTGRGRLPAGQVRRSTPWRLEIQNVGSDPGLCHRIGNETYCY